ncbi:MAG TPA: hypothetical protein VMT86_19925 [Bryobacteraceae bacterium]|nr:hypothetical protein [Bryobacteraceae bacterium]
MQPSLHIPCKNFDLKEYFKEGRGCRTEGTFRNAGDLGANKGLSNLPYLQKIGRQIDRRLLEVERVSHNSGLRGAGLKFGQPRVMALLLLFGRLQLRQSSHNQSRLRHSLRLEDRPAVLAAGGWRLASRHGYVYGQ